MIGKITTGSNFDRLFRYLLKDDKQARLIGGDRLLLEPNAKELASQFNWIASTRPTTKKPVKHLSIGFAPTDGVVDDSIKVAISEAVVNGLGYTNNQWIAIAHGRNDPGHDWQHDHDHIHIVINAIDFNGERVSDSFDKTRLEKILRELEKEYDLTTVVSSHECDRAAPRRSRDRQRPKTNQLKRYQRESRKYPDKTPEIPMMAKLEAAIDVASRDKPTMTSFIGRMQQLGIDVRPRITEKGRKRISYRLGNFKVRGVPLHNGSFPKLISERGIDFDEVRDNPAIDAAYHGRSVEIDKKRPAKQIPSGSLDWEQIDLHYWLPQPLKALANAHLIEIREIPDQKQWKNLQQRLLDRYGIPEHISAGLNEANLLSVDRTGESIWHKRSLLGSKESHFWFEINNSGELVKKMVVTNSPIDAVSAYLVDKLVNKEDCPCLYLSLDRPEQLIKLDLTKFDTVVINSSDKQLVSDNLLNLVVENNINSWQQNWLIHWNKVEAILKSQAKNTSIEQKLNITMELEL